MRQLWIMTPEAQGEKIRQMIDLLPSEQTLRFSGRSGGNIVEVTVVNLPNRDISSVITRLEAVEGVRVTLYPQDVFPLDPSQKGLSSKITRVTHRSPIEIWLNGLQSIGSWRSFLAYTLAAGIVVWIGLYTNAVYLLIAAMLIAPFAGPAMNLAIATATGDSRLLRRNLLRYFLSLLAMIAVTALLSLVIRQRSATNMMVDISEISAYTILLPLAAGAVGAMNLSQASNSSLVPGAAVGTLVAASLAPPAGVIGMALAVNRWDMALNGGFVLLLQLFAINLAGGIVFRLHHLKPGSVHLDRGKGWLFFLSAGVSLLLLAALLAGQFWSAPGLQRSTQAQHAGEVVRQIVVDYPHSDLVEANVRFPRPAVERQNVLLAEVYVEREPGSSVPAEEIRQNLTELIEARLDADFNIRPLVAVTVFE